MKTQSRFYKHYFIGFIVLMVLGFSSCKPTQITKTDGSIPEKNARFLVRKLKSTANDFEWFSARAKINYVDMTQNRSIKASIRIQKDSMIWMSFTFFGLEGARVKITPDSVYVVNRLEKQYISKPLTFINENFNIPADYATIEAILVGNPVISESTDFEVEIKDNQYQLNTKEPFNLTYVMNGTSYQLNNIIIEDENKQKVDMAFKEYATAENRTFSYLRDILMVSPKRGNASVEINFSKVEFDVEKQMTFEVPDNYKKVD